ncbi:MAG: energy transducer TonB [Candidatus Eisenbacteria sp.]|nr:energy transducer TonB [Candidatus Eisenbacteria bacterium]
MIWQCRKCARIPAGQEILLYMLIWQVVVGSLSSCSHGHQDAAPPGSNSPPQGGSSSWEPNLIVQPEYPEEARRLGLEGSVDVLAKVDQEGRVIEARIARSTNEIFNRAALDAAHKCRFAIVVPRKKKPLSVRISIPFRFTLPDSG